MDVSIVIASWNTRDILHDCLSSIYRQTSEFPFEVIVVDNGSADGSVEMVKSDFSQVHLIANSENLGYAGANNQAMTIARGRYILLLNSDTIVLNNAIGKMMAFADSHPEAGVIGCRVLNADQSFQSSCFMFPSLLNMFFAAIYLPQLFPRSKIFGRERMLWFDWRKTCEVDVVVGCFMFVRREAIDQIGMMDDRLFMYCEETDWCYRFKRAHWKIVYTPCAEIIHLGKVSSLRMKPKMMLQLRGSMLFFFKKHRGRFSYTLACLLVSLFFFLRIPFWLIKGMGCKASRRSDLHTAWTYIKGASKAFLGWRGLVCRSGI